MLLPPAVSEVPVADRALPPIIKCQHLPAPVRTLGEGVDGRGTFHV